MITFEGANGLPDPVGQYVAALLIAAVDDNNEAVARQLATFLGGELKAFVVDKATVPNDYAVIALPYGNLVAFNGTTNSDQILNYVSGYPASVAAEGIPSAIGFTVQTNWAFQAGLDAIQANILAKMTGPKSGPTLVAGYSYGAAVAFIFGRRLKALGTFTGPVQVLTFGEPKSFTGVPPRTEVDYHARIVANIPGILPQNPITSVEAWDPVPLLPPSGGIASLLVAPVYWLAQAFKRTWEQWGSPYRLQQNQIIPGQFNSIPGAVFAAAQIRDFVLQLPNIQLHYFATAYLPWSRALWLGSGQEPGLSAFDNFESYYVSAPITLPGLLGPSTPNSVINAVSFRPPARPVTAATRSFTTLVEASVYTIPLLQFFPSFSGESEMPTVFKGTVDFNVPNFGGWSESVYSDVPTETYQSMMQKMTRWLTNRMQMSIGGDCLGCKNPVVPFAIRVEDELTLRDTYIQYVLQPGTPAQGGAIFCPASQGNGNPTGLGSASANQQNLDSELGVRVKFQGGGPQQIANPMFHGVPIVATGINYSTSYAQSFLRYGAMGNSYFTALRNLVMQMANDGLGYRNITGAWNTPQNTPGPSSAPADWFYNTQKEMIELNFTAANFPLTTFPLPNPLTAQYNPPFFPTALSAPFANQVPPGWPNVNSKCRLQVRGWKSFPVLNGRWSAQVVAPFSSASTLINPYSVNPAGTRYVWAIRILRQCRLPMDGSVPFVSPIAWSYWWPGENYVNPPGQVSLPSVFTVPNFTNIGDMWASAAQLQYVQGKKLGRAFGAERGRQRTRAT